MSTFGGSGWCGSTKISTMFLVTPRTALNYEKVEEMCAGQIGLKKIKKELKREKLGAAMELLLFHASNAQIVSRM